MRDDSPVTEPKDEATAWERLLHEATRPRRDDRTPLMRAASEGDVKAVRALLEAGAAVDEATAHDPESLLYEGGRTALFFASGLGHAAVVELLLDAGAAIDAVADNGDTVAGCAAARGHRGLVELLLGRGAKPRPPRSRYTLLYLAAVSGDLELVRLVLARVGGIDEPIATGATPLMAAARGGSPAIVELLIGHGANVNARDECGRTALMCAVATDLGDVELFMRYDEDAMARIRDVAAALIAAGADVRLRDDSGMAALDIVARRTADFLDVARLLIATGADVHEHAGDGRTPLSSASVMRRTLVAAALLEAGAEVNARDSDGLTPLLRAVENGYPDTVQLLVECGADTTGAAERARAHDRAEVIPLLQSPNGIPLLLPGGTSHASKRAGEQFSAGDYAGALASYEWIPCAIRERTPGITSNMAYCHQQLGNHVEALRHFDLALARAPKMAHAWRSACFSACVLEAWQKMRDYALGAAELMPKDDYVWQQAAIAWSKLGRAEEAVAAGRRALEINENNGFATANLAVDLRSLENPEWAPLLVRAFRLIPSLGEDGEFKRMYEQAKTMV
jgi:ankyrin repeat protein